MIWNSALLIVFMLTVFCTNPGSAIADWGNGSWGELIWGEGIAVPLLPGVWMLGLLMGLLIAGSRRVTGNPRPAMVPGPLRGRWPLFLAILCVPITVLASTVEVPHTFINGTIADADEVNENFLSVEEAVNDNDARLSMLEGTGGVRAFAAVSSSGPELIASQTAGFASVRRPVSGVYCLSPSDPGLLPSQVPSMTTPNLGLSNASASLNVFILVRSPFVCQNGEFEVLTLRRNDSASGSSQVDLVDDVGFNIMLP